MTTNADLHIEQAARSAETLSPKLREAVLDELKDLSESQEFAGTRRGKLLLRYLVEHTFAGNAERIKERTIGVELFGRSPSYDTGQDSIVRVAANDVRKRLSDHYERVGTGGRSIRISIPSGCYIPEFQILSLSPQVAEAPISAETAVARPWFLLAAVLLLSLACAFLAMQNAALRPVQPAWPATLPWSMLSHPAKKIAIVPSDASLGVLQMVLGKEFHLSEYANGSWTNSSPVTSRAAAELTRMPLVTVTDADLASRLEQQIRAWGYSAFLQAPRAVQISDFKEDRPIVLLGSPFANRWGELLDERLNFQIAFDPALGRQVCKNMAPKSGEPTVYTPTARTGESGTAYATISLAPNLTRRAYILLIAGTNMEGVEAAGELLLDTARLQGAMRGLGIDPASAVDQMEILLRVECMTKTARQASVIAHRVKK